jgi:hypothetical protein
MAKIKDLPRSNKSNRTDLITILQKGKTKTISKKDLLQELESSINKLASQIKGVMNNVSRTTMKKNDHRFNSPIIGKAPVNKNHLTTKKYVDTSLHNVLRNDGTTKIENALSYRKSPRVYNSTDIVDKNFVDKELKTVLKTIKRVQGSGGYPKASAGDTFVLQKTHNNFATNGPEVQKGDLLMCVEDSDGGTHGEAGHQFAIVNTNVVFATESSAGILRAASVSDATALKAQDAALTPLAYKGAQEAGSEYNRTIVAIPSHTLAEADKGIVGVDCRRTAITLTLPSIGRLENPKVVKYLIKDEHSNSLKNNITIVSSGGDTIQGSRTHIINTNGASLKLYNDGGSSWYLESNISSSAGDTAGVKSFITNDITNGEQPTTTGAYESVMSIDVDLREYPIGTGFKVISHCMTAGNGNTKTVAIGLDGNQVLASSLTGTTAPNGLFIHHEVTFLHSDTAKYFAFGTVHMTQDDSAAGLTNNLEIDWDTKIKVSVDVLAATAATDVKVYALQVIPLK